MKASFLLPHSFKSLGWVLFPTGLLIWIATQVGLFSTAMSHPLKVVVLSTSFFACLSGFYFICFSKELIEDEYIAILRLKAFQISSLIQMLFFVLAFSSMYIFKFEPKGDGGLAEFLLITILLYWIVYLFVFNYTLLKNKMSNNDQ